MKNPEENIVLQKTKAFALRCIKLYKYMVDEKESLLFLNKYCVVEQALVLM